MRLVHVTEGLSVLDRGLGRIPRATLQEAARIGTETHRYALGWVRSEFQEFPVPDDILPYYEAFRKWFDDTVVDVLYDGDAPMAEWRFELKDLGLTGRLDLIAKVRGDRCWSLIDLKRVYHVDRVVGLQLAAYQMGAERRLPAKVHIGRRFALQIPKEFPDAK